MGLFKRKSTPSGLARLLFELVLEDEKKPETLKSFGWQEKPEFKPDVYTNQMFVYLSASIAFALTGFYSKSPRAAEVQFEFRRLVINEMKTRWGYSEQKIEDVIGEAAEDYQNLMRPYLIHPLSTGPSDEDRKAASRASLTWAMNWAKKMGIDEYNLMVLTIIIHHWTSQFFFLVKFLKKVL